MTDGEPKRVAIHVWEAMRNLVAITTDIHDLDGDFPEVTAEEIRTRLIRAQESIDDALDATDRVSAANSDDLGDPDE